MELLQRPLADLCAEARTLRDEGHGRLVTYSPKVFIPLTKLCRDVCHYCTFARPPRRGQRAYMTIDEVLEVACAGAAAGCREALFTLGDKPELRYRAARDELAVLGCETTLEYVARAAEAVLDETGLLPHLNPGVLTGEDLVQLRRVSASMGLMLETTSARRAERVDALLAIRELAETHGHVQEVIVQNFRAKPGTRMADASEPSLDDLLWTIAVARILLGPRTHLQAPPNLSFSEFPRLLDAGIDDWGGVSPVTIDHVNPEAPWPELERLRAATESRGLQLAARLPVYPEWISGAWIDPNVMPAVLRASDSLGLAREDGWAPGESIAIPFVPRDALPVQTRAELGEEEIVRLFRARGQERERIFAAADRLRLEICQGAATLGLPLEEYLDELRDAGLGSLPGTAAEILDDEVRRVICPDKVTTAQWLAVHDAAHRVGLRSNVTMMFGHVDGPRNWARHLQRAREQQQQSGGFTEFVPLPFVHMEAPMWLRGQARSGPTFGETLLVHAVARLALHPWITNVQVSWVKLGPEGVAAALRAGVNDLGGTLMNESISRSAGAEHGQEFPPERMEELIRSLGRVPRQRTTLYGDAPEERRLASFCAAPLAEPWNPPVKDARLVAPPRLVRPGFATARS